MSSIAASPSRRGTLSKSKRWGIGWLIVVLVTAGCGSTDSSSLAPPGVDASAPSDAWQPDAWQPDAWQPDDTGSTAIPPKDIAQPEDSQTVEIRHEDARQPDIQPEDTWAADIASDAQPEDTWAADIASDVQPEDTWAADIASDVQPEDTWAADIASDVQPEDSVQPEDTWAADIASDIQPADSGQPADTSTTLTIHTLDLWGQALPSDGTTLTVTPTYGGPELPIDRSGSPWLRVDLPGPGSWDVELSHADHYAAHIRVVWSGDPSAYDGLSAWQEDAPLDSQTAGLLVSHEEEDRGWTHTVHIGLRHRWFAASGPPARRGNHVWLLQDGEDAWGAVYETLSRATRSILVSTWWWVSSFELIRELPAHLSLSPDDRWENTIYMILWHTPAMIRTLVGEFWGQDSILSWMTTDSDLRAVAEDPDDGWEFLGQGNDTSGAFEFSVPAFRFGERVRAMWPELEDTAFDDDPPIPSSVPSRWVDLTDFPFGFETEVASWHQKFMVIDFETAFIGGMNLRGTDWDTSEHLVFDPRRLEFDASADERWDVNIRQEQSDRGPRKDYMAKIVGPSVADAAAVFHDRWSQAIEDEVDLSNYATTFTVPAPPAPFPDGVQAQVVATMPAPYNRADILDSWLNAIEQAERYIYVEDQYWRIPAIQDAIVARMQTTTDLRLLVVTKPVSEWTDPGCRWTYEMDTTLRQLFPYRYRTYQLRSFDYAVTCTVCFDETDAFFVDIDVHSKILIIDDRFLSVGSCNKNNRGVDFEGELNINVLDTDLVTEARRRIVDNILGRSLGPFSDFDDVWWAFDEAAEANDEVWLRWDQEGFDLDLDGDPLSAEWIPEGFVYPLIFRDVSDCLIESIGPDIAK